MKRALAFLSASLALAVSPASAAPEVDAPAPAFSGRSANGETISLDQFKGKTVVLEWTNDGCPFVQKHYETGNMQKSQADVVASGGVWITVISSAPGKQGHVDAARASELTRSRDARPDHVILDESGTIGAAYAAKTTPHMFVVDAQGILRYDGAIDDQPSANHATVDKAQNYVVAAFQNVMKGEAVAVKQTKPYGCSVKYGS